MSEKEPESAAKIVWLPPSPTKPGWTYQFAPTEPEKAALPRIRSHVSYIDPKTGGLLGTSGERYQELLATWAFRKALAERVTSKYPSKKPRENVFYSDWWDRPLPRFRDMPEPTRRLADPDPPAPEKDEAKRTFQTGFELGVFGLRWEPYLGETRRHR